MTGLLVLIRGHIAILITGLAAILTVVLIAIALSAWDGHRAEDQREHPHRRPSRLAAAYWWCRAWAAWWWWRARMAAHRPRTWWAWRRYVKLLPGPHQMSESDWTAPPVAKPWPEDTGASVERGAVATVTAPPLPAPATEEVMPSDLPGDGHRVSGAGGARPSPALPPAVTDALPDAAIDAIIGHLAAGWAIYEELAGQRYDTGWLTAVSGSA